MVHILRNSMQVLGRKSLMKFFSILAFQNKYAYEATFKTFNPKNKYAYEATHLPMLIDPASPQLVLSMYAPFSPYASSPPLCVCSCFLLPT